jgi:hypothetical protein
MKTKTKKKTKYRLNNWPEYNKSLKQRGVLELWITDDLADKWAAEPTKRPGNQPLYSDYAIEIVIRFGKIFKQKLRQTEGLLESVFKLMSLDLSVPDYSTVSRRAEKLSVVLFKKVSGKGEKKIVVIDSTGLKVYGEGEWKTKVHGKSKRRTWRKAHIVIGPDGEIQAAKLTENCEADCKVVKKLLNQIDGDIDTLAGDGGYDKEEVYGACIARKIKNILIPPQENAKIKRHGNLKTEAHPRDENLRRIRKVGRRKWKEESGYHARSLVETTMFRLKTIVGGNLNFRKFKNQVSEFVISCNILNRVAELGMPDSYAVT